MICIVMRAFEKPFIVNRVGLVGLFDSSTLPVPLGLPEKRVRYTLLRSPFIDKRSRQHFDLEVHTEALEYTPSKGAHESSQVVWGFKRRSTR
uniref:Ribosomal protein S10 n=1 Tax=Viscum scurruloideum TaxID=1664545 RepID=A0A0H3WGV2_9MAGN|nr:ribosomal protein S10 [Viscum scurruloideum]